MANAGICQEFSRTISSDHDYLRSTEYFIERKNQVLSELDIALERELKVRRELTHLDQKKDLSIIHCNQIYQINDRSFTLSNRQTQIINQLLNGKTSKVIAKELNISYRTVDEYINIVKEKSQCKTRLEMVSLFARLLE